MKLRRLPLVWITASVLLSGCATTDEGLSQKERDRINREMEKTSRKNSQDQMKAMQSTGQRRSTR
jgi:hypothetical protein